MSTRLTDLQTRFEIHAKAVEESDSEEEKMATPGIIKAIISVVAGIIFGISLEKGRVFEPQVIRDQMLFKRFVMLKMFLSATAIGMVSFSILKIMPQTKRKMRNVVARYTQDLHDKNVPAVAIGAAILGCGMTISGACPGTVAIQLGAGVPNAWITVAGGLFGAALYAMTNFDILTLFPSSPPSIYYLHHLLEIDYLPIALPMASLIAVAVFGVEQFFPWFTEIPESLVTEGVMKAGAWPPFVTGIVVGFLQIPIILANENTLGTASSYVTIISNLLPVPSGSTADGYLRQFRSKMKNWWQVLFVGGAVFGAFLSATASDTLGSVAGIPGYQAFGGGFLILYGSRIAGGCTSGHGLSGIGLLSLLSFVAVPAMFAGGIATAFIMRDLLDIIV